MASGYNTSKLNSAKLIAQLPKTKTYSGKTWVLVAAEDASYRAKDAKKKIDAENKRKNVNKKTKIVKKKKGSYEVYGIYQERF